MKRYDNVSWAFSFLKEKLRTDKACARYVGMTPQHYEALRNGRERLSVKTKEFIELKAEKLQTETTHAPRHSLP